MHIYVFCDDLKTQ